LGEVRCPRRTAGEMLTGTGAAATQGTGGKREGMMSQMREDVPGLSLAADSTAECPHPLP
jgi:hypothetical protein